MSLPFPHERSTLLLSRLGAVCLGLYEGIATTDTAPHVIGSPPLNLRQVGSQAS